MILVLLLSLFVVTISGLKLYAIEDNAGPLANMPAISLINTAQADEKHSQYEEEGDEEFWEELHEASANVMILLILLHILGVVVAGKLHKENLIKAMITGKKKSE
jgi:cytochrome b